MRYAGRRIELAGAEGIGGRRGDRLPRPPRRCFRALGGAVARRERPGVGRIAGRRRRSKRKHTSRASWRSGSRDAERVMRKSFTVERVLGLMREPLQLELL